MKIVREHINEKFSEKSDPVKDLSVGGVVFGKEFDRIYKNVEDKLYDQWVDFVHSFKGKWLEGRMARYDPGKYDAKVTKAKILVKNITMNREGLINLEVEGGFTFHLFPDEKYIISNE
jgi:hypothetical protein